MPEDKNEMIEDALYNLSGIAGFLVSLAMIPRDKDPIDGSMLMLMHDVVCQARDRIAEATGFDVVPGANPAMEGLS